MKYKIMKDGDVINTIVADEAFVTDYCEKNGYTFEKIPEPKPEPEPETEPETSVWDELDAAYKEGVNSAYEQ